MQKTIPIISSLCPSIPKKETEDRSGSFNPASPPTSEAGWATAADAAKATKAATAAARLRAKRHPSDTRSASQVRIGNPPLIEERYKDDYGFRSSNRGKSPTL